MCVYSHLPSPRNPTKGTSVPVAVLQAEAHAVASTVPAVQVARTSVLVNGLRPQVEASALKLLPRTMILQRSRSTRFKGTGEEVVIR